MRALRWGIAGALVIVLAVFAAPFVVPLRQWMPQLSELASMRLGQRVVLADLQLNLWPKPGAIARGVRIGKANEIVIDEVRLSLAPETLLDDVPMIDEIRARTVSLNEAGLAIMTGLTRRAAATSSARPAGWRIASVVFEDVAVEHQTLRLKPFDLTLDFGAGNALSLVTAVTRDGSFQLSMRPRDSGEFALEVHAKHWRVPVKEVALEFDSLVAEGRLRGRTLALKPMHAAIYDGRVGGEAVLRWGDRWDLRTALDIRGVNVEKLQRALNRPVKLRGRLTAHALVHSRAKRAGALLDAVALDAPFRVEHGAFGGVDLSRAASVSGDAIADGETRFDEFTGKLSVRGRARRVDDFCARSNALVAGGNVQVDARERLSGRLDVSLANTAGLVRVPVRLSGTSSEPVATPSQLMSVGAVIGTLLLPGVGTAIGASAAGLLEGQVGCS
jgi:uncharacterized protein involved in outer membrane biogenesis